MLNFGVGDKDGTQKWSTVLQKRDNPLHSHVDPSSAPYVPFAFIICSGPVTPQKKQLANSMLVDFHVNVKLKRPGKGKACQYYSPATQNVMVRSFLAHMQKYHGWLFVEGDFKGFPGALAGVLMELYAEREKKYVSSKCV